MAIRKSASARYEGLGKAGKGYVSTESGVLNDQPYGFNTRFDGETGTNPEELVGAAHAACYTMALAFQLEAAGFKDGQLDTQAVISLEKDGDGFTITRSALQLTAQVDGIADEKFAELADAAKQGCPLSKLMNTDITLEYQLN